MINILTVVGARPQIIKAAALSRAIRNSFSTQLREQILHTGQHYDAGMSQVFFDELEIPAPDFNLHIGSATHGRQTAMMIEGIEMVLLDTRPDFLVVYGDTNSTLAGAVAASKHHVPVVHIEAGLRSFNKSMPEEINRIVCDHVSTLLFTPTQTGVNNLVREGFRKLSTPPFSPDNPGVFHCGDIMYDNTLYFASFAEEKSKLYKQFPITTNNYILCTIHRDNNTDNPERLNSIFSALSEISLKHKTEVVLPMHPRTSKMLETGLEDKLLKDIRNNPFFRITSPVSFLDMIMLEKYARLIITDSGGVQKESYFFKKPCIVLRRETEWIEIVENDAAILADADKHRIEGAWQYFMEHPTGDFPPVFGDGNAAEFICRQLILAAEFIDLK